jgi:hypothetical protein
MTIIFKELSKKSEKYERQKKEHENLRRTEHLLCVLDHTPPSFVM